MSNFLAIATVTATLSRTLQEAVGVDVSGAQVTIARPDSAGAGTPTTGVNLYLYQVTPNATWRNADLPTRRSDGQLVQRPQAALDLHYLLSFYGNEAQLEPQRLLGSVVRTLHAQPVLTRDRIRATIADPTHSFLVTSNLADAVELVKFTPIPLSLEELSKLWSVFFQTPYNLSVAYQATVVLIEGEEMPETALPVRDRNIYVVPFRHPTVEQVLSQAGPDRPIVAGSTLIILGKYLRGEVTRVRIGELEVTPAAQDVGETQIGLPLPAGLRAGVHVMQVIHRMLMGTPQTEHRGVESNVAAFVLHPTITAAVVTNGTSALKVTLDPKVSKTQRVVLLLNEFNPNPPEDRSPRAYSFEAPKDNGITEAEQVDTDSITFAISGVEPGDYLVRVQVDGASSPLATDTREGTPTFGLYIQRRVTI